jgi:ParB family chromosome partitioning protein
VSDFCHISRLTGHPGNIRDDVGDLAELAASIREHGILQAIVVREHPQRAGHFVVLAGHRRLAAARLAGLAEIPITVRDSAGPTQDIEIMLVENCQRRDLGPIEKAEAMGKLRKRGYSGAAIAKATGLSESTVSYFLSLLTLDAASRARVRNGTVEVGHAIAAVKAARALAGARKAKGKVTVAADHFGGDHPLFERATVMCELAGHTGRKAGRGPYQRGACGHCWETVIRADERTAAAHLEAVS